VWQGKFSTIVRVVSHLPVGFFDGINDDEEDSRTAGAED
jgi:hypothetical protein